MRVASLDGTPTVTLIDTANTTSGDWGDDGWIYVEGGLRHRPDAAHRRAGRAGVRGVGAERHEIGAEFLNVLPGGKA